MTNLDSVCRTNCGTLPVYPFIRVLAATFILSVHSTIAWCSDSRVFDASRINREAIIKQLPSPEITHQRIYISFEGSPKMTRILQEKLKSKGLDVVGEPALADVLFKLNGHYTISSLAKQPIVGPLAEVLERTIDMDKSASSQDYQTVDLLQLGSLSASRGSISVPDLLLWITQKIGIAGRFNEMLTGDARGWYLNEKCKQYESYVEMRVYGDGVFWRMKSKAWDEKIVLDILIADVLENTLVPFYQRHSSESKNVGTDPQ